MRDTYYKSEPQKLESNHFFNTLVFNKDLGRLYILKCPA